MHMKKIFLPILMLLGAFISQAQVCVPGTLTGTGASYIIPDTTINFAEGCVNQTYLQYIYLKVPKDTTLPIIGNCTVDSFVINKNITGLPAGLIVESNPVILPAAAPNPKTNFERLKVKGDSLACIKISGTITSPVALYNLSIGLRAYVKAGIIPFDSALSISNYRINVKATGTCSPASVSNLSKNNFELIGNMPNPASQQTQIVFESSKLDNYSLKIINALGDVLIERKIKSSIGLNYLPIDVTSLSNGIYLYSLSDGRNIISKKMQVIK